MTPEMGSGACFTDFALQEYVQGRLEPQVRAEVESHVQTCRACLEAIEMLRTESAALAWALQASTGHIEPDPADMETLARYLDGALDSRSARELESRLARDRGLMAAMISLVSELRDLRAEAEPGVRQLPTTMPEGTILRMPKRTVPPLVATALRRKAGGLD